MFRWGRGGSQREKSDVQEIYLLIEQLFFFLHVDSDVGGSLSTTRTVYAFMTKPIVLPDPLA